MTRAWSGDNSHLRRGAVAIYQTALRRGELVRQPCEVCGGTRNVDGHHDDYARPLEVRWLCRMHHMSLHMYGAIHPTEAQLRAYRERCFANWQRLRAVSAAEDAA